MGYWENTTYVNHGSALEVVEAMTALFAREGMQPFEPALRARRGIEPMQYEGPLDLDVWGVAAFPGAAGWTVVKTAPLELLAARREGADRMRLAELCGALGARAVQHNVYDSTDRVVARVSRRGRVSVRGSHYGGVPCTWHGETLGTLQFLLRVSADLVTRRLGDDHARTLAARLGGANAASCENHVSVVTLVQHEPLAIPGGVARYFRWTGPSRQRAVSCDAWDAYRAARGPP